jgi:predicted alpha/beta superfamily hydrolase
MKKVTLVVVSYCICFIAAAQVRYDKLYSNYLNAERQFKVKLPENYDADANKNYPLVVVFDGDYLFEPVVGQVEYQSYFDYMPQAIVIGLLQGGERYYDSFTDEISGLPSESGLRFQNFIADELLPFVEQKYGASTFKMLVGQDLMGNFAHSYLLAEEPLFQAYICISPDFQGRLNTYVDRRLSVLKTELFYYLSTYSGDRPQTRNNILELDQRLAELDKTNLIYHFDDIKTNSYITAVSIAISDAFHNIFGFYQPISETEIQERIRPYEGYLDQYLTHRYKRIHEFFGIDKPITEDEINKVLKVAEDKEDLKSMERLGKFANKLYPESLLGSYYLGLHAEKTGKPKKAKKLYESALELNELSYITKDYIFSKLDQLSIAEMEDDIDTDIEDNEEH